MEKKKPASKLLENMNRHFGNKYKVNEEEMEKEDDKEVKDGEEEVKEEGEADAEKKDGEEEMKEDDNENGEQEKAVAGIVEKLISEDFGADNAAQCGAADDMKKLGESDEVIANKFMEAMSDCASAMKIEEDADGEAMVVFEPEKWAHLSEARKAKKMKK